MKKEVLTVERCREELIASHRTSPALWIFLIVFSLTMTALFGWLVGWVIVEAEKFAFVHGVAMGILAICYLPIPLIWVRFVIGLISARRMRQTIRDGELEIVEDTLKRAYEDADVKGYGKYRRVDVYCVLVFENYGDYRLPGRKHYVLSDGGAMYDNDIFKTSREGDVFYIVRLKDDLTRKPLEVYNAKFFWYSEDGSMTPPRTGSSWRDSVSVE